eukprot:403366437
MDTVQNENKSVAKQNGNKNLQNVALNNDLMHIQSNHTSNKVLGNQSNQISNQHQQILNISTASKPKILKNSTALIYQNDQNKLLKKQYRAKSQASHNRVRRDRSNQLALILNSGSNTLNNAQTQQSLWNKIKDKQPRNHQLLLKPHQVNSYQQSLILNRVQLMSRAIKDQRGEEIKGFYSTGLSQQQFEYKNNIMRVMSGDQTEQQQIFSSDLAQYQWGGDVMSLQDNRNYDNINGQRSLLNTFSGINENISLDNQNNRVLAMSAGLHGISNRQKQQLQSKQFQNQSTHQVLSQQSGYNGKQIEISISGQQDSQFAKTFYQPSQSTQQALQPHNIKQSNSIVNDKPMSTQQSDNKTQIIVQKQLKQLDKNVKQPINNNIIFEQSNNQQTDSIEKNSNLKPDEIQRNQEQKIQNEELKLKDDQGEYEYENDDEEFEKYSEDFEKPPFSPPAEESSLVQEQTQQLDHKLEVNDYKDQEDYEDTQHNYDNNQTLLDQPNNFRTIQEYNHLSSDISKANSRLTNKNRTPNSSNQQQNNPQNPSLDFSNHHRVIQTQQSTTPFKNKQLQNQVKHHNQIYNNSLENSQIKHNSFIQQPEVVKVDGEPSSAEYNIKGQFDKSQALQDQMSKIKKHKVTLKNLWDQRKETLKDNLISKIQPPGPGQYIDNKKYSSLQRKGYSFSKDQRIFEKMTKQELQNLYQQKLRQHYNQTLDQTQTSLMGNNLNNDLIYSGLESQQNSLLLTKTSTISPMRLNGGSKSPDKQNPACYSFTQNQRSTNVRKWDQNSVKAWPKCFYEGEQKY